MGQGLIGDVHPLAHIPGPGMGVVIIDAAHVAGGTVIHSQFPGHFIEDIAVDGEDIADFLPVLRFVFLNPQQFSVAKVGVGAVSGGSDDGVLPDGLFHHAPFLFRPAVHPDQGGAHGLHGFVAHGAGAAVESADADGFHGDLLGRKTGHNCVDG